jgi:hypothetical protein
MRGFLDNFTHEFICAGLGWGRANFGCANSNSNCGGSKAAPIARSLRKIADKIISHPSLCNKKLNFPRQGYSGIGAIRYAVADVIAGCENIDLSENSGIIHQNLSNSRNSAITRRSGSI